jgi:tRNA threonylcarbamoyladenosine biosynthesis protein TsaB
MLWSVDVMIQDEARLLLIDTCGEGAGVALSVGEHVRATVGLTPRGASAEIVSAVRLLLQGAGWKLSELDGVGVVAGPGSFTGVRAGLAAAKGFCEAGGLRLGAVSRLEVLAEAGVSGGDGHAVELAADRVELAANVVELAVLDAGRDEMYVRECRAGSAAREWVCGAEELRVIANGRCVAIAEERVALRLAGCAAEMRTLTVADALRPVLRCLRERGSDVAMVDANYVRGEAEIYKKKEASSERKKQASSERKKEASSERAEIGNAKGRHATEERAGEAEDVRSLRPVDAR